MFAMVVLSVFMTVVYVGWILVLIPFLVMFFAPLIAGLTIIFYLLAQSIRAILHSDLSVQKMKIFENGNPLVNFAIDFPELKLRQQSLHFFKVFWARRKIGQMLMQAERSLDFDYHLLLVEGYRSNLNSRKSELHMGHNTGGAFDITLTNEEGQELDLGPRLTQKINWYGQVIREKVSLKVQQNRKVLSNTLEDAGFVNNPLQWWHWSYGDQYWCARTSAASAIYANL